MTYVNFVSDEHFRKCVKHVCDGYNEIVHDEPWLHRYGLDIFKIMFDMGTKKLTYDQWRSTEELRRDDKTISNKMGEFHQKLLGGVEGWIDLETGNEWDLKKEDNSIIIELKNKENTLSGSGVPALERRMDNYIEKFPNVICYWAYVISINGKSEEKEWRSPQKRKITGSKIYELITGDSDALKKMWKKLPTVIEDVLNCTIERDSTLNDLFEKTFFRTERIQ